MNDDARTGKFDCFAAHRALIDGGWLARLRPVEVAVLLVYLRFADNSGNAWPSLSRVARHVGQSSTSHAASARRRLVEVGWLADERRMFANKTAVYRVTIPRPVATVHAVQAAAPTPESGVGPNPAHAEGGPTPKRGAGVRPNRASDLRPNRASELPIEQPRKNPARRRKPAAGLPPIPSEIDTPEVRAAWADFVQHRRERRPAVTPTSAAKLLEMLAGWGPLKAVAALEKAVASGWQGVFPLDAKDIAARGHGRRDPPGKAVSPGVFVETAT